MKIDCVLTATNDNKLYMEFIPMFIRLWKHFIPTVDVKIIFVASEIPDEYIVYKDNLILFEPIENINTAFIAQYIRLLYPAIMNYQNGVLITDMDIMPMNSNFYVNNVKDIDDNKFVYLRDVLLSNNQIAMCYNVATPQIWSEINDVKNMDDIKHAIIKSYNEVSYTGIPGEDGWSKDQQDLYKKVMLWNSKTGNFVSIPDKKTKFVRLDRNALVFTNNVVHMIKSGRFCDYHALRPYEEFRQENEYIEDLFFGTNKSGKND